MDTIFKWIGEQSGLFGSFQALMDIALVAALIGVLFFQNRTPRDTSGTGDLSQSLGKIIEETKAIAEQFESNLKERQILIQQLITKLDQRMKEAQDLCNQLKNISIDQQLISPSGTGGQALHADQRKVIALARQGLDAETIAKRLQKPLGEVELILNIQRLTSDR
jgi:hypothetical protein